MLFQKIITHNEKEKRPSKQKLLEKVSKRDESQIAFFDCVQSIFSHFGGYYSVLSMLPILLKIENYSIEQPATEPTQL